MMASTIGPIDAGFVAALEDGEPLFFPELGRVEAQAPTELSDEPPSMKIFSHRRAPSSLA